MNKKTKIAGGVLSMVLLVSGVVGCGISAQAQAPKESVQASVTAQAPTEVVKVTAPKPVPAKGNENDPVYLQQLQEWKDGKYNQTPPAPETAGKMADPQFLRQLAKYYELHPEEREAARKQDNPNNLPVTYASDGRPIAPNYNSITPGDQSDPTYLRALADWYDKNPPQPPKVVGYIPLNPLPENVTPTEDSYVPNPNDGYYHPSIKNPAGILVHKITFHEGFRAPGLKALDVEVFARSTGTEDNTLVRGRDEIVSATGSTGKVYDLQGSKGTGVTLNYYNGNYHEERIIQYKDISEDEKYIDKVVIRRDGKLITIDAKDAPIEVTHP